MEEELAPTPGRWRRTPALEISITVMVSARGVSVVVSADHRMFFVLEF